MELTIEEALKKALALHKNNRIDAARALYGKILVASPNHPVAHYNVATLLMQKNEFTEAIKHLNIAIDQNRKTAQIWYALTLAYFLQREFQSALKTIGDAAQTVNLNSTFMELRQKILMKIEGSNTVKEAPDQYVQELSQKVSNEITQPILEELESAIMKYPLSEQIEQLNGLALAKSGDSTKAISHYRNALLFNSNNPAIYNNIGLCWRNLNNFPKAVQSFQKAIEIKSNYLKANYNLANTYDQMGIYQEAIDYYRAALDILPDFLPAKLSLTNLYSDNGYSSEAKELIADIDISDTKDPATLLALINHYNNIGQFERSEKILNDYSNQNGPSEISNIKLISNELPIAAAWRIA